ncbi:hypothetical protein F5148DRAFT_746880 [Russula earlei]|uniref:Uncharacterized protein n=1 Tax=Russula earlei TaxID=71964 RepID=A0ACC0TTZ8_9AGAM|nr:hypothetical protein F5148DRAFT_746880 [Russula earlei]
MYAHKFFFTPRVIAFFVQRPVAAPIHRVNQDQYNWPRCVVQRQGNLIPGRVTQLRSSPGVVVPLFALLKGQRALKPRRGKSSPPICIHPTLSFSRPVGSGIRRESGTWEKPPKHGVHSRKTRGGCSGTNWGLQNLGKTVHRSVCLRPGNEDSGPGPNCLSSTSAWTFPIVHPHPFGFLTLVLQTLGHVHRATTPWPTSRVLTPAV